MTEPTSPSQTPPSDAELHAYVDRQLSAERHAFVAQYLLTDPVARKKVEDWQKQNQAIVELFGDDHLIPTAADHLRETATSIYQSHSAPFHQKSEIGTHLWGFRNIAAGLILFVFGGLGGFLISEGNKAPLTTTDDTIAAQAISAHQTYVVEVLHPVDVNADKPENKSHLAAWLSKRLGGDLSAPDLSTQGFSLVGGNLLPASEGPAAQFMYEDDKGQRLTLYATQNSGARLAAFQYVQMAGSKSFYWRDSNFSYALVGDISRQKLDEVAKLIYRELE